MRGSEDDEEEDEVRCELKRFKARVGELCRVPEAIARVGVM